MIVDENPAFAFMQLWSDVGHGALMIGAHSYHLISAHLMCLHYVHACGYCTIPATHTISKVLHHHKFCIIASSQVLLGTLTSFVWEQKSLSFHISIGGRGIVVETEEQYFSGNANPKHRK